MLEIIGVYLLIGLCLYSLMLMFVLVFGTFETVLPIDANNVTDGLILFCVAWPGILLALAKKLFK